MPVWLITIAAKAWSALGKLWAAVASFAVKYPWQAALIALACFTGWTYYHRYNVGWDASEAVHKAQRAQIKEKIVTTTQYVERNDAARAAHEKKLLDENLTMSARIAELVRQMQAAGLDPLCVPSHVADELRANDRVRRTASASR